MIRQPLIGLAHLFEVAVAVAIAVAIHPCDRAQRRLPQAAREVQVTGHLGYGTDQDQQERRRVDPRGTLPSSAETLLEILRSIGKPVLTDLACC